MMTDSITSVYSEVIDERERQKGLEFGGVPAEEFDKQNTVDNWVSFITTYAGAAGTAARNKDEDFRVNMKKVAALAIAAMEARDKGYC